MMPDAQKGKPRPEDEETAPGVGVGSHLGIRPESEKDMARGSALPSPGRPAQPCGLPSLVLPLASLPPTHRCSEALCTVASS